MLLILGWVRKWGGTHPQGLEIKKAAPIFLNKNKVWRGRGSARQAKKQDYPDFSKLIYHLYHVTYMIDGIFIKITF